MYLFISSHGSATKKLRLEPEVDGKSEFSESHICDLCMANFSTLGNLRRHRLLHSADTEVSIHLNRDSDSLEIDTQLLWVTI